MNKKRFHIGILGIALVKKVCQLIGCIIMLLSVAAAEKNNGAEKMILFGGSRGEVPFPHRMHQDNLKECDSCHSIFPQVPGAIEDMKAKEKLNKKQVMTKLCIKCHKAEKMAGNKSGPTRCSACHVRE